MVSEIDWFSAGFFLLFAAYIIFSYRVYRVFVRLASKANIKKRTAVPKESGRPFFK